MKVNWDDEIPIHIYTVYIYIYIYIIPIYYVSHNQRVITPLLVEWYTDAPGMGWESCQNGRPSAQRVDTESLGIPWKSNFSIQANHKAVC